jgi:REP element-mobilizing transposase RayT
MPYSDLRIGRRSMEGTAYHITTATQRREPVFADFAKAREVIRQLRFLQDEGWAIPWVLW